MESKKLIDDILELLISIESKLDGMGAGIHE